MTIGDGCRLFREKRGFTQAKIEELTGVKREYISKIENDHIRATPDTLERILTPLNYKLSELFAHIGR